MNDTIEYEIKLRVRILTEDAGRPAGDLPPYLEGFYDSCPGRVEVVEARRITPAINYGGPR
jgi:hypothetical protein